MSGDRPKLPHELDRDAALAAHGRLEGDAPRPRAPGLRVNETAFQAQVIDLARFAGWRVAHFRPAMDARGRWSTAVSGDGAGFPDLVLVRDRLLFVELKTETGTLRAEQVAWLAALRAGVPVGEDVLVEVWRPSMWPYIEAVLTRRRAGS